MEYVIGVDGGGTKTAFALADRGGAILAQAVLPSISYREHGMEMVSSRLQSGVKELLAAADASMEDVKFVAVGAPGYGENADGDRLLHETVAKAFPFTPFSLVNDAQIACYGALGGKPGINIVAGTGSIAYGEDEAGHRARSGGWSEHFSDEGSCYWLGKQAMGLFCKEADGREPRAALYEIVRKELPILDDFGFIAEIEKNYLPERSRVAGFQKYLLQAAQQGDEAAAALYVQACRELTLLAAGVRNQLSFTGEVAVSLTGGLTHCGELVEGPLTQMLSEQKMRYVPCKGLPVEGAVYLARREAEK